MVLATGLKDLGFRGNTYTWANNKHGQAYVAARLDRAFSNTSWLDSFVDPLITHLPKLCSDHSPLLLSHRTRLSSANIPFKFEAMCLSHDSFFKVVETSWATCCSGNPQFILARKLKILKTNPKVWNKEAFGQLKVRIAEAERAVLVCQHSLDANPSEASHLELNSAKFSLHNCLKAESDLWRPWSKIRWLQDGDRNTKFFRGGFKGIVNCIDRISVDGTLFVEEGQVRDQAKLYFSNLM